MLLKPIEINQKKAKQIVLEIRMNDSKTLTMIYRKTYPMVEKFVLQNNGTLEDAKDIFQDAFYLLMRKVKEDQFELTAQPSTYLFGISKNLWFKELTKKRLDPANYRAEQELEHIDTEEDEDSNQLNRVKKMKNCLMALGEPCKTILEQFYFFKSSMKKIAEMLHYSNPEHAKNQKYKCFVRLKKMVYTNED